MNIAVVTFPGSNCDRDIIMALETITGNKPQIIWHKDPDIGKPDLVLIPGGFSFGDYLRCGAIAARSPAIEGLREYAMWGGMVMGICNGFQILVEAELLPGALIRNSGIRFVCRKIHVKAHETGSSIMANIGKQTGFTLPVAHIEGQYFADDDTLTRLKDNGQIAFTYAKSDDTDDINHYNPNGSAMDIAGIVSENGKILGMMPHPERMMSATVGGDDGARLLSAIITASQS